MLLPFPHHSTDSVQIADPSQINSRSKFTNAFARAHKLGDQTTAAATAENRRLRFSSSVPQLAIGKGICHQCSPVKIRRWPCPGTTSLFLLLPDLMIRSDPVGIPCWLNRPSVVGRRPVTLPRGARRARTELGRVEEQGRPAAATPGRPDRSSRRRVATRQRDPDSGIGRRRQVRVLAPGTDPSPRAGRWVRRPENRRNPISTGCVPSELLLPRTLRSFPASTRVLSPRFDCLLAGVKLAWARRSHVVQTVAS